MSNLRNATLLECLFAKEYDLRTYSRQTLCRKLGREAADRITLAKCQNYRIPYSVLREDPGCIAAWEKSMDERTNLSISAIMDIYRNGPESLIGSAKDQMIKKHHNYIFQLMKQYFGSFSSYYADDLYDCGVIGLLEAMKDYNGEHAFTTYSKFFIIHEMAAYTYFLQGNPSCYYAKIQKKISEVLADADCAVPIHEISEKTGINIDIVKRELGVMRAKEHVCLDEYPSLKDTIVDPGKGIDEIMEEKETERELERAVLNLNPDERSFLKMYFYDNYSFGHISRELGLNYNHVKKKYREIIDTLKREVL